METIEAIQLIRDDHKRLRGLFRQLDAVDFRAKEMKVGVVRETLMELEIHARIEEEIFYPAAAEHGGIEAAALVDTLTIDHEDAAGTILRIRDHLENPDFLNSFLPSLIEDMEGHFEREERDLLPLLTDLGKQAPELSEKIIRRREMLLRNPEYRDSQAEQVQNPNGGEQMRKAG